MRILLTNDDGILSPGIEALYRALADFGEIAVVAPESSHSGAGHAISVLTPVAAHRVQVNNRFEAWAVCGNPADCVKLAMLELLDRRPDFVISGINAGINTGLYIFYSGTVAGAAESAIFFDVPSMAVSLEISDHLDFERAGRIAREVFERFASANPLAGTCINVNIPALDSGWPKGVRVCPQCLIPADAAYQKQTDAGGRQIFWLDGGSPEQTRQCNTDTEAVLEGYVAVTPLKFDVTDRDLLPDVSKWNWPERFDL